MKHHIPATLINKLRHLHTSRGFALATTLLWLGMLMVLGTGLVSFTTAGTIRVTSEENGDLALNGADAGLEQEYNTIWRPFRDLQRFDSLDTACAGSSTAAPTMAATGRLPGNVAYTVGVVGYTQVDNWTRDITIQCVGWVDSNGNGILDNGETSRAVEVQIQLGLDRSKVFDYAYFVNNYGWMQGFGPSDLVVNGDMRANGNFDFSGGTPTINGSVYACQNNKLIPPAAGIVNITPTQWTNSYYNGHAPATARQAYDPTRMGAYGTAQYQQWRDLIYDQNGSMQDGSPAGAVVGDVNGTRTYSGTVLDPQPTTEVVMPDLSDITFYENLSQTYVDTKQTYQDGTANPYYDQGSYINVWNSSQNKYVTVTTNGVVTGSVVLVGTSTHPIQIHGPATATGDIVIKGVVQGQGTLYAGRNVHIVGNVTYSQSPNFTGSSLTTVDQSNEKKDMLGLAARGSIIMGDTSKFDSYTLQYMTPPFTKARYDDNGNLIPAYNATQVDSTGNMLYQSVYGDAYIHSISEPISQINAVLYTNFLGGGNLGTSGGGVTFNGSIISRDESMILYSLPLVMNYDNRLKQRLNMNQPLIDVNLPLAPDFKILSWSEL